MILIRSLDIAFLENECTDKSAGRKVASESHDNGLMTLQLVAGLQTVPFQIQLNKPTR